MVTNPTANDAKDDRPINFAIHLQTYANIAVRSKKTIFSWMLKNGDSVSRINFNNI
jgi:hypothetical protein